MKKRTASIRKISVVIFTILVPMFIVVFAKSSQSAQSAILHDVLDISSKHCKDIVKTLKYHDIEFQEICISENQFGLDEKWTAYKVKDEAGNEFTMILQTSDNSFSALLDNHGKLIEGIIDYDINLDDSAY